MLSLAYRIATMKMNFLPNTGYEVTPQFVNLITNVVAPEIKSMPKIRMDNVSKFHADSPKEFWSWRSSAPNWSPPFRAFWVEFVDALMSREFGVTVQVGTYIDALELPDADNIEGMKNIYENEELRRNKILVEKSRWAFGIHCFSSATGKPLHGMPFWCSSLILFIDKRGELIGFDYPPEKDAFDGNFTREIRSGFGFFNRIMTIGLGISFMHCKNVRQVETKDDPGERFRKQYGVPKYTYRTLQIDPMKEVLRREGRSDTEGLQRALHICRGHFSTYSEEKPLFGKYPGTFWVHDHVRGNKERGEVVKDYDVKGPDQE